MVGVWEGREKEKMVGRGGIRERNVERGEECRCGCIKEWNLMMLI